MAKLTKKERQEQAEREMREQARISAALRWTDDGDILPDVPPPESTFELTTGYMYNAYTRSVTVACSSAINHAIGRTDRTTAQRPIALYSTRLRALRALRVAVERQYAQELAKIDAMIESED